MLEMFQIRAMEWLVRDAQPNDSLFFHCKPAIRSPRLTHKPLSLILDSGHGGQTKDLDGDEEDGFDEGILHPLCHQYYGLSLTGV